MKENQLVSVREGGAAGWTQLVCGGENEIGCALPREKK